MNLNQSPSNWVSPQWHSDCGDPAIELEHLRIFAITLTEVIPNIQISLELPEPGLMLLEIKLPNGVSLETYSNPSTIREGCQRLELFVFYEPNTEIEKCFEEVNEAVEFLRLQAK